jgi:hypothetical protein
MRHFTSFLLAAMQSLARGSTERRGADDRWTFIMDYQKKKM